MYRSDRLRAALCLLAALTTGAMARGDDWPQWLGPQRDGVWRETGLVEKFPESGPRVLWRKPLGLGYAGPAVAGGRVFVMDLMRETDENGAPLRATRQGIPGRERIVCLDAANGETIWIYEYECPYTISYPSGPRTTPVVENGRVYALGAMGDLLCLDAADGRVHWSQKLTSKYQTEPPVWGYASHLLVDGDRLYTLAGGDGSAVVALDKNTGAEIWRALTSEEVGYAPPMIYDVAGKRQLIIWLSEAIYGLDPVSGAQLWKTEYPQGVPPQRPSVNIITPKLVDDLLFISTFYHGPMMLKITDNGASVVWKGKSNNPVKPDGAHCLMASPIFADGLGYACGSNGEFVCFDQATGEKRWESYEPIVGKKADCGAVFTVPQDDRCVMFNDQGELILARLTAAGYQQQSRAKILEPAAFARGRDIVWSHPAFAQKCVFARNDLEIICVSLAADQG